MTTSNTSASDVTFRVRPLGFDRNEVQAFIGNLLNDYAQVSRELDRLRNEMAALREFPLERKPATDVQPTAPASAAAHTAREVERILAGAERIADEIRSRAHDESTAVRQEADAKAAAAVREADARASELLKEAEARAAEIVEGAVQQVVHLDRQAAAVRAQCTQMRAAIKSASEAAALALNEIAAMEDDREPAFQTKGA
jgi:cell division septum initiation protein DivIVA